MDKETSGTEDVFDMFEDISGAKEQPDKKIELPKFLSHKDCSDWLLTELRNKGRAFFDSPEYQAAKPIIDNFKEKEKQRFTVQLDGIVYRLMGVGEGAYEVLEEGIATAEEGIELAKKLGAQEDEVEVVNKPRLPTIRKHLSISTGDSSEVVREKVGKVENPEAAKIVMDSLIENGYIEPTIQEALDFTERAIATTAKGADEEHIWHIRTITMALITDRPALSEYFNKVVNVKGISNESSKYVQELLDFDFKDCKVENQQETKDDIKYEGERAGESKTDNDDNAQEEYTFTRGKYAGYTVAEVAKEEPTYLYWLSTANFKFPKEVNEDIAKHVEAYNDTLKNRPVNKELVFKFGKYRGEKVVDVAENNMNYIEWCSENITATPDYKKLFELLIEEASEQKSEFVDNRTLEELEAELKERRIVDNYNEEKETLKFKGVPRAIGSTSMYRLFTYSRDFSSYDPKLHKDTQEWVFSGVGSSDEARQVIAGVIYQFNELEKEKQAEIESVFSGEDAKISDDKAKTFVSDKVQGLIRKGLDYGLKEHVVDAQIADVGHMLHAYKNGMPTYLLANEAGTGKTFVMGGFLDELKNQEGVTDVAYITMNKDLIAQVKNDLAEFDIEHVNFQTYSALGSGEVARHSIVLADESHNIANPTSNRGLAGADLLGASDFSVLASATPFKNPAHAAYIESTGLFGHLGFSNGFEGFAKRFGVVVNKFGQAKSYQWSGDNESGKKFREWFTKQGLITQRAMELPAHQIDLKFTPIKLSNRWRDLYDQVEDAFADLIGDYSNIAGETNAPSDDELQELLEQSLDGLLPDSQQAQLYSSEIMRYRENTLNRILEFAKLDAANDEAKLAIAEGRSPVMFTQTRSARHLGRFRMLGQTSGELYTYPEMADMMDEWKMTKKMAHDMGDFPPPPPFAPFILEVAKSFHRNEIDFELPSSTQYIKDSFPNGGVLEYTGALTPKKAQENIQEWKEKASTVNPIALVATEAKGATGLSLQNTSGNRPTTQIMANIPNTAAGFEQVLGRTCRYGLVGTAKQVVLLAPEVTVEVRKVRKISARLSDMGAAVKGIEHHVAEQVTEALENGEYKDASNVDMTPEMQLRIGDITPEQYVEEMGLSVDSFNEQKDANELERKFKVERMLSYYSLMNELTEEINSNSRLTVDGVYTEKGKELYGYIMDATNTFGNPFELGAEAFTKTLANKYEKKILKAIEKEKSNYNGLMEKLVIEEAVRFVESAENTPNPDPDPKPKQENDMPSNDDSAENVEGVEGNTSESEASAEAAPSQNDMFSQDDLFGESSGTATSDNEATSKQTEKAETSKNEDLSLDDVYIANADLLSRIGLELKPINNPFEHLTDDQVKYIADSGIKTVFTLSELPEAKEGQVLMNGQRPMLGDDVSEGDRYGFGRFFAITNISDDFGKFNAFDENLKLDAYLPIQVTQEEMNMLTFVSGTKALRFKNIKKELANYNHTDKNKDASNEQEAQYLYEDITSENIAPKFLEFSEAYEAINNYNLVVEAAINSKEKESQAKSDKTNKGEKKSSKPEQRIEDTDHIAGARKERYERLRISMESSYSSVADAITFDKKATLASLMPKKNLSKMESDGDMSRFQALVYATARSELKYHLKDAKRNLYDAAQAKTCLSFVNKALELDYEEFIEYNKSFESEIDNAIALQKKRELMVKTLIMSDYSYTTDDYDKLASLFSIKETSSVFVGGQRKDVEPHYSICFDTTDRLFYHPVNDNYQNRYVNFDHDKIVADHVLNDKTVEKLKAVVESDAAKTAQRKINKGKPKVKLGLYREKGKDGEVYVGNKTKYGVIKVESVPEEFASKTVDAHEWFSNNYNALVEKAVEVGTYKYNIGVYSTRGADRILTVELKNKNSMTTLHTFESGTTVKEVQAWLKDNRQRIEDEISEETIVDFRSSDASPRVGEDWRKGEDVSQHDLKKEFNLKGVQFGNSTLASQKEAQSRVNDAYDAMCDMAETLNISRASIGLGGNLALAFGARGRGGINAPVAHYEPLMQVINITRPTGKNKDSVVGSLFHEWLHALDNHLGRMNDANNPQELSDNRLPMMTDEIGRMTKAQNLRSELFDDIKNLVNRLEGSGIKEASKKVDKLSGKDYWATPIELFARTGEAYIKGKLADKGFNNSFLVTMSNEHEEISHVIPSRAGIKEAGIEEAFDRFFSGLKELEPEKGSLLYKVDNDPNNYQQAAYEWLKAADTDELFRYRGLEEAGSLPELLERFGISEVKSNEDAAANINAAYEENGIDTLEPVIKATTFKMPKGEHVHISETENYVWADLSNLKSGDSQGSMVYQIVTAYAYHSGKVLTPDPEGANDVAAVRGTEAMISSALRFGTTKHIMPHVNQGFGFNEGWGDNVEDDLATMIERSYEMVKKAIPEIEGIEYDFERPEFRAAGNATNPERVTNELVGILNGEHRGLNASGVGLESVLGRRLPADARALAGSSTIKRAIITRTLLSKGNEKEWRQDFPNHVTRLFTATNGFNPLNSILHKETSGSSLYVIDANKVQEWIEPVVQGTGVEFSVVETMNDLPVSVRSQIERSVKGVYDYSTNTPYIIADKIQNEQVAVKVAMHEGLGHSGLIAFLERNSNKGGKELNELLDRIFDDMGAKEIRGKTAAYNFDFKEQNDRREAVLEYIAHVAETAPYKSDVEYSTREVVERSVGGTWGLYEIQNLLEVSRLYSLKALELKKLAKDGELSNDDLDKAFFSAVASSEIDLSKLLNIGGAAQIASNGDRWVSLDKPIAQSADAELLQHLKAGGFKNTPYMEKEDGTFTSKPTASEMAKAATTSNVSYLRFNNPYNAANFDSFQSIAADDALKNRLSENGYDAVQYEPQENSYYYNSAVAVFSAKQVESMPNHISFIPNSLLASKDDGLHCFISNDLEKIMLMPKEGLLGTGLYMTDSLEPWPDTNIALNNQDEVAKKLVDEFDISQKQAENLTEETPLSTVSVTLDHGSTLSVNDDGLYLDGEKLNMGDHALYSALNAGGIDSSRSVLKAMTNTLSGESGQALSLLHGLKAGKTELVMPLIAEKLGADFISVKDGADNYVFTTKTNKVEVKKSAVLSKPLAAIDEKGTEIAKDLQVKGEPVSFYHGTNKVFSEFSLSEKGSNTNASNTELGFFFLTDQEVARNFARENAGGGDIVMEVNLSFRKAINIAIPEIFNIEDQASTLYECLSGEKLSPKEALDMLNEDIGLGEVADMYEQLSNKESKAIMEEHGYDAVISEFGDGVLEYVVFHPEQIEIVNENVNAVTATANVASKTVEENTANQFAKVLRGAGFGVDVGNEMITIKDNHHTEMKIEKEPAKGNGFAIHTFGWDGLGLDCVLAQYKGQNNPVQKMVNEVKDASRKVGFADYIYTATNEGKPNIISLSDKANTMKEKHDLSKVLESNKGLEMAFRMQENGYPSDVVDLETGWKKGDTWYYDVSNKETKLTNEARKVIEQVAVKGLAAQSELGDVLQNESLYKHYPNIEAVKVNFTCNEPPKTDAGGEVSIKLDKDTLSSVEVANRLLMTVQNTITLDGQSKLLPEPMNKADYLRIYEKNQENQNKKAITSKAVEDLKGSLFYSQAEKILLRETSLAPNPNVKREVRDWHSKVSEEISNQITNEYENLYQADIKQDLTSAKLVASSKLATALLDGEKNNFNDTLEQIKAELESVEVTPVQAETIKTCLASINEQAASEAPNYEGVASIEKILNTISSSNSNSLEVESPKPKPKPKAEVENDTISPSPL